MRRLLVLVTAAGLLVGPAGPVWATTGPPDGWSWPLAGHPAVVRGFEPPAEPWLPGHRGVDLAGRRGEPVLAAAAGVVLYAGPVAGMPVVSITHPDGLVTTYQPVRPAVRTGDPVRRGQRIGRLMLAGSHCPPRACLHWGLRRGADYLDPLALIGAAQVRLLPFGSLGSDPSPAAFAAGSAGSGVVVAAGAVRLRRRRRRAHSAFGQTTTR